jgi:urease accessory protein
MRSQQVVPPGSWAASEEIGAVALDYDMRHRRRIVLTMEQGDLLIDLPQTTRLRDGDGLLLDGGGVIRIAAAPEPLMEITAADSADLIRLAWHLGNRHLPTQLLPDRIRIRTDHVIADMIHGLGGHVHLVQEPFDPEQGAYAGGHGHGHDDHR